MSSFDGLQARALKAKGTVLQVGTDEPVVIRLRYVGTGTVTSVTVTTATNIVMVTSDGGTDTYAFATYTTVAKLIAAINDDGIFEAKCLDGLLSDATASVFVTGAITSGTDANGVTVWDVLQDSSAAKQLAVCLSNNRDWNTTKLATTHRVHVQEIKYYATLGGAAAGNFEVYLRRNPAGALGAGTETLLFDDLSVSATATTYNWASGYGKITGEEGDEIVVILKDGTSIADAAANYLRVVGILE